MQPASSQSAFDWEGGSIDELVQILTTTALAVRVEVRTPAAGKPKKIGEIHLVAGGVSEVLAGELRGDDAMEHLRGVSPLSFRLQPRLPNPDDGGLLVPGPSEGTLAERPPAEVMRYCELYVLTCVIEIWRDTDRAEIEYRKGEIARTVVNGADAPEQLHEVMNWSSGGYRLVLPDLALPAPTSRTPQPQMVPAAGAPATGPTFGGAAAQRQAPAQPKPTPSPQKSPAAAVVQQKTPAAAVVQQRSAATAVVPQKSPAPAVQQRSPATASAAQPTPTPQARPQAAAQAKTMYGMPAAMMPIAVQTASPAASVAARATQPRAPEPQPEKRSTSSGMRVDLYDKKDPDRITNMGVPAVDVTASGSAEAVRPSSSGLTAASASSSAPAPAAIGKREHDAPTGPQEDLTTLPAPAAPSAKASATPRRTESPRPLESHQKPGQKQKKKSAQKTARPAERSSESAVKPADKREMSVGVHIAIGLALGLGIAAAWWVIQIIGGG